jgi:hypothetical protein
MAGDVARVRDVATRLDDDACRSRQAAPIRKCKTGITSRQSKLYGVALLNRGDSSRARCAAPEFRCNASARPSRS